MELFSIAKFNPDEPYIYPLGSHYTLRREMPISMNAKQFYQAAQSEPLEDILSDSDLALGEVIEIDDGLCPYYFYYLNFLRVIPVPFFHPQKTEKSIEEE